MFSTIHTRSLAHFCPRHNKKNAATRRAGGSQHTRVHARAPSPTPPVECLCPCVCVWRQILFSCAGHAREEKRREETPRTSWWWVCCVPSVNTFLAISEGGKSHCENCGVFFSNPSLSVPGCTTGATVRSELRAHKKSERARESVHSRGRYTRI